MADADSNARPQSRAAEDCPWYLLATLYGTSEDAAIKNRNVWNRFLVTHLASTPEGHLLLDRLMHKQAPEDLAALSSNELGRVQNLFHVRRGSKSHIQLPDTFFHIDFSGVQTPAPLCLAGFIFPVHTDFRLARFESPCTFESATFLREAHFEGVQFEDAVLFNDALFVGSAHFDAAQFARASFKSSIFEGSASFSKAESSNHVDFASTTFDIVTFAFSHLRSVDFGEATFASCKFDRAKFRMGAEFAHARIGDSSFRNTLFGGYAVFEHVTFSAEADFEHAEFENTAQFHRSTFKEWAQFADAVFYENANFSDVTFERPATFERAAFRGQISFTNAEMSNETVFEGARFLCAPPQFFGAKMHEGTEWYAAEWPPNPKDIVTANRFVLAYERLKLEMDRLKKHEDELNFFALELQSRRVLQGSVGGFPITLYGVLCDYGRSYVRPIYWLILTIAAGAAAFWPHFGARHFLRALGLSAANVFAWAGIRKDFAGDSLVNLPDQLVVLAAIQTMLGAALVFLFGLSLRNRFRMR